MVDVNGYLAVGDCWYWGWVLLVFRGDKVLVVNYVNLEYYLISVVGSEMYFIVFIEVFKVQAIVVCFYVLVYMVCFVSQWFDLGDI